MFINKGKGSNGVGVKGGASAVTCGREDFCRFVRGCKRAFWAIFAQNTPSARGKDDTHPSLLLLVQRP